MQVTFERAAEHAAEVLKHIQEISTRAGDVREALVQMGQTLEEMRAADAEQMAEIVTAMEADQTRRGELYDAFAAKITDLIGRIEGHD